MFPSFLLSAETLRGLGRVILFFAVVLLACLVEVGYLYYSRQRGPLLFKVKIFPTADLS